MNGNTRFALVCLMLARIALPVSAEEDRPITRGGAFDKPHIVKSASGGTSVGGYAEVHFRNEEEEGRGRRTHVCTKAIQPFLSFSRIRTFAHGGRVGVRRGDGRDPSVARNPGLRATSCDYFPRWDDPDAAREL